MFNRELMIQARKSIGLTQQELADLTNLAQNTISGIESGKLKPSLKSLSMIACALKKPASHFIIDEVPVNYN